MKNLKSLLKLIPYLKRYKAGLILGVVFVILSVFFTTKVPRVMGDAIDVLGESFDNSILFDNVVLILIYAVVHGVFRFLMRNTMIGISRKIEFDIRNDFFKHFQILGNSREIFTRYTDKLGTLYQSNLGAQSPDMLSLSMKANST